MEPGLTVGSVKLESSCDVAPTTRQEDREVGLIVKHQTKKKKKIDPLSFVGCLSPEAITSP